MKNKKSLFLAILGVIMITTSIMYRKYRRAELREQQLKVQREEAKKMMEYQRKQDSIKQKAEYDGARKKELEEFNKKNKAKEISNKLEAMRKKLQEEAKKSY